MDILKSLFPISVKAKDKDSLVKAIVIYAIGIVLGAVVGALSGALLGWIPVVGGILSTILGIVFWLLDVYCVGGIVVSILCFCKVIE